MTTVLAIDQGTSGTKAVVVNADDEIIGIAECPVTPRYDAGGVVEQSPWQMLNSVLDAARQAIDQAGVPIEVLTLANQGETVLAWDPDTGEPLTEMVVWQDRRAESVCTRLNAAKERVAHKTGLVLDPYFSAPKQAWIRENRTREGVVTTSDTWLLYQLTGQYVTDVSTASRSLVLDIETGQWDNELLDIFGLTNEKLPTIVESDVLIGTTKAFGREIPVGGLIVDQQAALLAQHCLRPGDVKCTFGTGAFMLANVGQKAMRSQAGLALSVAWSHHHQRSYCLDGQVYTAASAIRWLIDLGLISKASELDEVAAEDAGGVMSVPALAGLAAPWWKPAATASFSGMTLSTQRGHLVLAVLQGIAAQIAEMGSQMEQDLGIQFTRMRVDGGLTQSRVLMQAVADLMQIEIDVYPSQHATPLGAVALARMAKNPSLQLEEAVIQWSAERTYTPRWSKDRAAEFRHQWRQQVEQQIR